MNQEEIDRYYEELERRHSKQLKPLLVFFLVFFGAIAIAFALGL